MQKWFLISLLVPVLACNQPNKNATSDPIAKPTAGILLRKSDRSTAQGFREEGNWCFNRFPDAIPVDVPPDNSNERDFNVPLGITKIVVDFGKITSSFFLLHTQAAGLELFTSHHFSQCLSKDENFSMYPGGNGFRYDNHYEIQYDAEVIQYPQGYRIKIRFPISSQYGIAVHHCSDCPVD